jgi:hypothetical protein
LPKDPEAWAKFNKDFNTGGPYTMFRGTQYAHVMIPVEHYYQYQKQKGSIPGAGEEPDAPHKSKEWKIWAYSSAAPPFLSGGVTVLDGPDKVLREGSNGFTCMAANPNPPTGEDGGWKNAHEAMPICGDKQAFKWIWPYVKGETPHLDTDGWAWMLHGDMGEDNSLPGKVGNFEWGKDHKENWIQGGPHLMLLPKDPEGWKDGTADFNVGGPYVMFRDTKYAHVMIPQKGYYHYQKRHHGLIAAFSAFGYPLIQANGMPTTTLIATMALALCSLGLAGLYARRARSSQGPRGVKVEESEDEEFGHLAGNE